MVRESRVELLVALELLASSAREAEEDGFGTVAKEVLALQDAELLAAPQEPLLSGVYVAFAEGEVINGVEQVGFAHAVIAEEAVDLRRAMDVGLTNVFIVQDGEFVQYHNSKWRRKG